MRTTTIACLLAAAIPALVAMACNPSNNSAKPESPDTTVAEPEDGVDMQEPADSESTSEPPTGDVALPPPSASAWNTGQSDGSPGKADRGIKDYQKVVQDNREKFRACYNAALAKNEGIKGRVTLVWVLDPKGVVKDGAHVDAEASDIQDPFLENCMVAALKSLTFPTSTRGMDSTVRYPFQFNPHSRPQR